jgi:hypothetical protein
VFGGYLLAERVAPLATACFLLWVLGWGFAVQPAILNRCHLLTLWLLIFGALRNLVMFEARATSAWRFSTAADVYRVFVGGL